MPLYYFRCPVCHALQRRILEPEEARGPIGCKTEGCSGKPKREPRPPSSMLKERVDNGLMPKTLENYVDGQELTKARSTLDLSKPDWQKTES